LMIGMNVMKGSEVCMQIGNEVLCATLLYVVVPLHIPSLLPRLTCSEQIPAITSTSNRPPDVVLRADTLCLCLCLCPHVGYMFPPSCPARAEMPGIVLDLALHASAGLALCPLPLLVSLLLLPCCLDSAGLYSWLVTFFFLPKA
jgi:hypothetical protein